MTEEVQNLAEVDSAPAKVVTATPEVAENLPEVADNQPAKTFSQEELDASFTTPSCESPTLWPNRFSHLTTAPT